MTTVGDDELREMLKGRGDRHAIDLGSVVDVARSEAIAAPRRGHWMVRAVVAGFASVVAVVLGFALVVIPLSVDPTASAVPSALGAPTIGPSSTKAHPRPPVEAGLAQVEALTAPDLADWLTTAGAAAYGRVVLLEGELITDGTVLCPASAPDCAPTIVRGAPTIVIEPVGDIGPGPWEGSGPLAGTFALRGTDRTWSGSSPVMEYLGTVRPTGGRLAWRVSELDLLSPADGPALYLVAGWIVRTSAHPCPSPASAFDCPTSDMLTPVRVQPTRADGSSELPELALRLPSGTYDEFAPDPAADGTGVVPRPGNFLVQRVSISPCGPNADCYVGPEDQRWIVRARVDPIAGSPSLPAPPATPAASDRYPGGIPKTIDGQPVFVGLDAQARWRDATDATPFFVGGWFDSRIAQTCSGGIGPFDPNPLAARGCPRYDVDGLPGRPVYPESLTMPEGDSPIILRVHTRDSNAATCIPEYIVECWRRVVVEDVAWFGDATTAAEPIGPRQAIERGTGVVVMESRHRPDADHGVSEDVFTVPITCRAPWPVQLFSIHGDPRYGLVAAFSDATSRERFQVSTEPSTGVDCLGPAIERPAAPRWVGHDNVLVLTFADDAFNARLQAVLDSPKPDQTPLPMVGPQLDRSLETISDYLVARGSGELDHAWGERMIHPIFEDPGGPRDVVADAYAAWTADVFRRHAAHALVGRIEALDDEPTQVRIGPTAWRVLQEARTARSRIYRVTYPDSSAPDLATEEFLVIQMPDSLFRDWQLVRVDGAPYPDVP